MKAGTHCPPDCTCYRHANLQPCGTWAAAQRHYRRGEKPCELCLAASRARTGAEPKQAAKDEPARDVTNRQIHRMDRADWDAMWAAQQGLCYLCDDPLPADTGLIRVDHDHSCCGPRRSCPACRRGLTCNGCNVIIGMASEDPVRLRRIADNLEAALKEPPQDIR